MLEDEIEKKIEFDKKSPKTKINRNINEWGPNAKLKNKRGNNINWLNDKIKKKFKHFTKELKTKTQNQKKNDQIWNKKI